MSNTKQTIIEIPSIDICLTKQISNDLTPLTKLETKLKTLTGLLCDSIYDHLIFNVQENSSGTQYRHKLQEFLSTKQYEFYNKYITTKY
jgi:hypothetical protein